MSTRSERQLRRALERHGAAVNEFVQRAYAVDPDRWLTPRAEGKWTPAQETQHIILSYDAFIHDLDGAPPVRVRGTPWKRFLWRAIGLTQILWFDRIPAAVKAPREIRPEPIEMSGPALVPQLRKRAEVFESKFAHVWKNEPKRHLTHYMFGPLSLRQSIHLMTVHTRHHAAFLPPLPYIASNG